MTTKTADTDLRGYTTDVVMVKPTLRAPCPEHETPGWLERSLHAVEHGWPEGSTGGPWREDCPACQQTPPIELPERVVGWETTDPRVVGVTSTGEAILIHNRFRRAWWRLTHRRPR